MHIPRACRHLTIKSSSFVKIPFFHFPKGLSNMLSSNFIHGMKLVHWPLEVWNYIISILQVLTMRFQLLFPNGLFEACPYTIMWTFSTACTPIVPLHHATKGELWTNCQPRVHSHMEPIPRTLELTNTTITPHIMHWRKSTMWGHVAPMQAKCMLHKLVIMFVII
jgi:hypothetical protein